MNRKAPPSSLGVQQRFLTLPREAINAETRTCEVAFSSETPVERWWGREILDHSPGACRLGRLLNGGAVLVNHDPDDQVGVVESAAIDSDRMGRATLRLGQSSDAAEILQDLVDGIRRHVSVGYIIHKMQLQETGEDVPDTYLITDWEPVEISIVAIPADPDVGVGRALPGDEHAVEVIVPTAEPTPTERNMEPTPTPAPTVDVVAVQNAAREAEMARTREILAIGNLHNRQDLAQEHVSKGTSLDEFRGIVLAELAKGKPLPSPDIGLSDKEIRSFSIVRAIEALAMLRQDPRKTAEAHALAGFEFEASQAAAKKAGKESRGIMIPSDVLRHAVRDLTTATTTGTSKAGYTVQTDLLSGSFIDVLRNKAALPGLGAVFLSGLQGNIAIPKKTAGATSYWVAENSAPTEGSLTFGQVTMSPKTVAAFVDYSRRLTLQSSLDVEALVRDDLTTSLALAIDEAAIGTSATNKPTGVRGTSGIGSVAIGTNGGAPTWAAIVNLEKAVDVANANIGAAAYLTNSKVRAKLKQTPKQASGVEGNFLLAAPYNDLGGYPLAVSNQVPSNLTKGSSSGVCSAMFFGVWSNLVIGQWGGIDLLVDPYTGSSAGTVRVTAFADVDVAVRYAEAFAACLDLTTT